MIKTKTELSFNSVLLLGINGIIGSGVFLLPGTLFKSAGWMSIAIIGLAGLATLLIAMDYAAMASKIDEDGGAWIYANQAFGRHTGFQIGWFSWFLGVITISTETAAFLTTLSGFWPDVQNHVVYIEVALIILGGITVLNYFGPGTMKVINDLSSAVKVGLILLFIVVGGAYVGIHGGITVMGSFDHGGNPVNAFTTAFYMFTGFSFLPIAAKQMKNAEKTLPRALIVVMIVVMVLYMLTQFLTILLLGSSVAIDKLPVAAAFMHVLGSFGRGLILAGMLISTLGVAIAVSFDTPVGLASLATEKKLLPREFGRRNHFGSPDVALISTMGLSMLLVVSGSYLFLVKLIVLSSFVQYIATALSLLKLRNNKMLPRGVQLWGGPTIPVLSLILLAYLIFQFNPETYVIGIGFAVVGELIYWVDDWRNQKLT